MIPNFPEFKKLELADKNEIESFTHKFPPYSDFNFVSMWSWDIKGDMRVSQLNNNLVVRFNDYLTGKPFLSFIGNNNVEDTLEKILEFSKFFGIEPYLKLIPEETANEIKNSNFKIVEDRDNFDYICDVNELRNMDGSKYKQKRNEINSLISLEKKIIGKEIDLTDPDIIKNFKIIFNNWMQNKISQEKNFERHEINAFENFLRLAGEFKLIGIGVFVDDEIVAFMICETIPEKKYAIGHASKSESSLKGVNSFLMKTMSEILFDRGILYFNYEQDLGIDGLRQGKTRFRPIYFLKKYIISYV